MTRLDDVFEIPLDDRSVGGRAQAKKGDAGDDEISDHGYSLSESYLRKIAVGRERALQLNLTERSI